MPNPLIYELKSKTQALKRIAAEKERLMSTLEKDKPASNDTQANGSTNDVIRTQEAKAREKQLQATNIRLRMATAVEELKRVMDIEPGLSHTTEYAAARQALRDTVRLFVN